MSQTVDFTIKQNDLAPTFDINVLTGADEVVDLTGFTSPEFHMWNRRTRVVKVDTAATIVEVATGLVRYQWTGTDTNTPGLYEAEFSLTLPSGQGMTLPNDGYYLVEVIPEIS